MSNTITMTVQEIANLADPILVARELSPLWDGKNPIDVLEIFFMIRNFQTLDLTLQRNQTDAVLTVSDNFGGFHVRNVGIVSVEKLAGAKVVGLENTTAQKFAESFFSWYLHQPGSFMSNAARTPEAVDCPNFQEALREVSPEKIEAFIREREKRLPGINTRQQVEYLMNLSCDLHNHASWLSIHYIDHGTRGVPAYQGLNFVCPQEFAPAPIIGVGFGTAGKEERESFLLDILSFYLSTLYSYQGMPDNDN